MKRIINTISMLKELDQGTLEGIRYTLFFFIVIDLVLFYWFMKWKQFAIAVFVVACVILAVILLLERKFPPDEEIKPKDNKPGLAPVMNPKPKEKPQGFINMDLGLPSADEFQDRLDEAIET